MATTTEGRRGQRRSGGASDTVAGAVARPLPARGVRSVTELGVFTSLVALLAIFADAAIGHALLWENDPYWTYWVTKTFLIATVFGLGTAWLGTGLARGAVITAAHTVVLTIYYWSLSPIGLPSQPSWLDLEHTWVTGLPVHFGVIYLGYVVALWMWQRRPAVVGPDGHGEAAQGSVATTAWQALAVGGGVVLVAGALESVALQDFPGVTWFVVRLLIAVPFTLVWWAAAGRDRAAAVAGGLTLAFVLVTYSHFLGPVGLPDTSLRLVAQDPPPSPVEWLTYREEFLVALPITVVVATAGFVLASRWWAERWAPLRLSSASIAATAIALVALVGLGAVAAANTTASADRATITSAGAASVEQGAYYRGDLSATDDAQLRLVAENRNPRVTPLPPHDRVDLTASFTHPDGTDYEIAADRPLVDDPSGRFSTWWGVGFDQWHHGRSGVGSEIVPATRSDVAVFALGTVSANGETIATGVPIHVMTMDHDEGRLELDVGDPSSPIPGLPDGHLRVVWQDYDGAPSERGENARYALGAGVLAALLVLAITAVRREEAAAQPTPTR